FSDRERDQIFVASARKESAHVRGLAIEQRQERLYILVLRKCHHDDWRGRDRLRAGQQEISASKLLQFFEHARDLLCGRAAINLKMRCARGKPGAMEKVLTWLRGSGSKAQPRCQTTQNYAQPSVHTRNGKASNRECHLAVGGNTSFQAMD